TGCAKKQSRRRRPLRVQRRAAVAPPLRQAPDISRVERAFRAPVPEVPGTVAAVPHHGRYFARIPAGILARPRDRRLVRTGAAWRPATKRVLQVPQSVST